MTDPTAAELQAAATYATERGYLPGSESWDAAHGAFLAGTRLAAPRAAVGEPTVMVSATGPVDQEALADVVKAGLKAFGRLAAESVPTPPAPEPKLTAEGLAALRAIPVDVALVQEFREGTPPATDDDAERLIALAEAATDGPWREKYGTCDVVSMTEDSPTVAKCWSSSFAPPREQARANRDFIAAARTLAPAVARQLGEARERVKTLEAEIAKDSWSAEMQRALDFIPREFTQNDAWENGVKRMADEITRLREALEFARTERGG